MLPELKLYRLFIVTYLKSKLQYKFSLFVQIIGNMINIGSFYVFLIVIFGQVSNIAGWTYNEALFLVSINWLCTSICGFFFWAPMMNMGDMIKDGSFDSMLIRPISPLKHCIYRQFQYTFIGRLLLAVFFLILSIVNLNIEWSFVKVLYFILVIISGSLIHGALYILMGSLSFWVIDNSEMINMIASYDGIRTLIDFPLSTFNKVIQVIFTFILPYSFVNYYPSVYILAKDPSNQLFWKYLQYMTPVVAVLLFVISIFVWNRGIKRYCGSGS